MAKGLWQSESAAGWNVVREDYDNIFQQHASDKLQELNTWYEDELLKAIASRSPNRHITQPELVNLVDWKLTYGKWRPRLLDYAKAATEQHVQDASSKAFALLDSSSSGGSSIAAAAAAAEDEPAQPATKKARKSNTTAAAAAAAAAASPQPAAAAAAAAPKLSTVKAALECLTVLKGVGPATASAVLAAVDGSCPFMGDEALEAALGKRDYTVKMYLQLVEALREKADWLNKQGKGSTWTAVLVERCLYAAELQHKEPPPAAGAKGKASTSTAGGKRKIK